MHRALSWARSAALSSVSSSASGAPNFCRLHKHESRFLAFVPFVANDINVDAASAVSDDARCRFSPSVLAPTIEMLLPPANIAVIKSFFVSPLLARTEVPSFGWMIRAAPIASVNAQTPTSDTRIAGPQNEKIDPCACPNGLDIVLKIHQTRRASWRPRMPGVCARVKNGDEDVNKNEEHQQHTRCLLKPLQSPLPAHNHYPPKITGEAARFGAMDRAPKASHPQTLRAKSSGAGRPESTTVGHWQGNFPSGCNRFRLHSYARPHAVHRRIRCCCHSSSDGIRLPAGSSVRQ